MEARHGDGAHEDGPRQVSLHVVREDALHERARAKSASAVPRSMMESTGRIANTCWDDRSPASASCAQLCDRTDAQGRNRAVGIGCWTARTVGSASGRTRLCTFSPSLVLVSFRASGSVKRSTELSISCELDIASIRTAHRHVESIRQHVSNSIAHHGVVRRDHAGRQHPACPAYTVHLMLGS